MGQGNARWATSPWSTRQRASEGNWRSSALSRRGTSRRVAVDWLDALAETWQKTELAEEKSDVIHAVYERIVIEGPRFVGLRLTPAAYRHGLALALPDAVMARPTGVGHALTAYRMPIEGRDEWIAAVERLA